MLITQKRIYISIVAILLVTIFIVIFFQPMQTNKAADKMTEALNKQYDEQFEITWSNIEQQPSLDTFEATVKSKKTGYVYDVVVKESKPSIQYDDVNKQMAKSEDIEQLIPNSFAAISDEAITILTTATIKQQDIEQILNTADVQKIDVYVFDKDNYKIATEHIDQYYQRSTMPLGDLQQYNPKHQTFD